MNRRQFIYTAASAALSIPLLRSRLSAQDANSELEDTIATIEKGTLHPIKDPRGNTINIWAQVVEGERGFVEFLHGNTQNHSANNLVAAQLHQQGYSILTFDWPGHGRSDSFAYHPEMKDYAEMIQRVAQYFGVKDQILVAHSFGGFAGYQARHMGIPHKSMVAISSSSVPPPTIHPGVQTPNGLVPLEVAMQGYVAQATQAREGKGDENANTRYDLLTDTSDQAVSLAQVQSHRLKTLQRTLAALVFNATKGESPVLNIYGDADLFYPIESQRAMKERHPNLRYATLSGGHNLPLQKPVEIAAEIRENANYLNA